jgi:chaperone required for assembly of F1-ATPase
MLWDVPVAFGSSDVLVYGNMEQVTILSPQNNEWDIVVLKFQTHLFA